MNTRNIIGIFILVLLPFTYGCKDSHKHNHGDHDHSHEHAHAHAHDHDHSHDHKHDDHSHDHHSHDHDHSHDGHSHGAVQKPEHSINWNGTYEGVLPCDGCKGIKTKVVLKNNGTFSRYFQKLGTGEKEMVEDGAIKFTRDGRIALNGATSQKLYMLMEGSILALDKEGKMHQGVDAKKYLLTQKQ